MTAELLKSGKARLEELYRWRIEMAHNNTGENGAWQSVQNQIKYMEKFVNIKIGGVYC
jgi:hypothetical protein